MAPGRMTAMNYLEFEKPLSEIEGKAEELRDTMLFVAGKLDLP